MPIDMSRLLEIPSARDKHCYDVKMMDDCQIESVYEMCMSLISLDGGIAVHHDLWKMKASASTLRQ